MRPIAPFSPPLQKMSECLRRIIGSYDSLMVDQDSATKMVGMAAIGWNLAQFPVEEREAQFQKISKQLLGRVKKEHEEDMRKIVWEFLARKERLYSHDQRWVAGFNVVVSLNGISLEVAAAVPPKDDDSPAR